MPIHALSNALVSAPQPSDVALALDTLADALDEIVPTREVDRNLVIATWNIREFGGFHGDWSTGPNDHPKRNLADLHFIAEIISRFDVVAIQEAQDDLSALRVVMMLLGPDWALLTSDLTYGTRGKERLAYVFDTRRVRPSGLVGELVLSPEDLKALRDVRAAAPFPSDRGKTGKDRDAAELERDFGGQLDRTPYIATFTSAGRPFMLATVHLVWGTGGDLQRRAEEARLLAMLLARTLKAPKRNQIADEFRANLLALGDLNAEGDNDPIIGALREAQMTIAAELSGVRRTTSDEPGVGGKIAYDQFAWFPQASKRPGALGLPIVGGGSFPWDDHILADAPSKTFHLSDHYPLWLELSVRERR